MLPFPTWKSGHDDVLELADEDLILVEASPLAPEKLQSIRKSIAELSAPPLSSIEVVFTPLDLEDPIAIPPSRSTPVPPESVIVPVSRSSRPSYPRLIWDADAENDVADECLASIAAETEKVRRSDPFLLSSVRPPPKPERERKEVVTLRRSESRVIATSTIAPPPSSASLVPVKIPKPNPPPRSLWARKSHTSEIRPSLPSLFARKTPDAASIPGAAASGSMSPSAPPVAFPSNAPPPPPKNEPTVILLRERPRGAWVLGSAAIGALCAVTAMHFLAQWATPQPTTPPPTPTPTIVTMAAPPPPSVVTAPPPPITSATTTAAPEVKPIPTTKFPPPVVRFNDDQGVAIAKPKPKAPLPLKPAAPPLVPDTGANVKVEPTPPKPKRPLTPEQELSEAQLKASLMK